MKVGDIDIPVAIIDLEVQVNYLTRIITHMTNNHGNAPAQFQLQVYLNESREIVKAKYPNMGIEFDI